MNARINGKAATAGVWARTGVLVAAAAMLAGCGGGGGGGEGVAVGGAGAAPATTGMTPEAAAVVNAEQDIPNPLVDTGTPPPLAPPPPASPPTEPPPAPPPGPPQPVPALTPELREAGTKGLWSAPETWPINAIHAVLTPDGKVMSYGSNPSGEQGAQLYYDVWNPVTKAHALLQHTTGTDLFCNAQLVLPVSGQVLLAGGDVRGQNLRNAAGNLLVNTGVADVNLFDPVAQSIKASGTPMNYSRWYDTLTTLADGRVFVLAGIGILLNGSMLADAYVDAPFTLADGFAHTMWVDYDARSRKLSVFLSRNATAVKPVQPVLQRDLDLERVVDSAKLYVGFTAANGLQATAHQIDNWSFVAGASPTAKDRLAAGEQLIPGQRLVSPDGRFGLTLEESGNLVLTEYASSTVRWQSGTAGKPAARLALGSEGHLVLYGLDLVPIWKNGNTGSGGTAAVLGNDGVLVLQRADGTAVWRSAGAL